MMKRLKTGLVLVLMLALCMSVVPAGAAGEIRIPASAAEALTRLPMDVPPIPRITVDDTDPTGRVVYIAGLEAWPLKDGSKYQSGAFTYSYYAEKGPIVPIQGREDEPLSIAVPQKYQGCAFYFALEKGTLSIQNLSTNTVQVSLELEDSSYDFAMDGTLERYTFQVGRGERIIAYYGADGLLYAYDHDEDQEDSSRSFSYDALGRIISTDALWQDDIEYCCINDQWHYWNGNGYTPCEKPEGIEIIAPSILEPKESVTQIEKKREDYQASMPTLPPKDGLIPQRFDMAHQFPAAPVLTQEETENGDLRYALAGLEPWGIEMRYDYVYTGSAGQFERVKAAVPGQVSWTIPAELISNWKENPYWRMSSHVIPENIIKPTVRYYDWEDVWVFTIYAAPDAEYSIALGLSPYVWSCRYMQDGDEVMCYYTPQGTLDYAVMKGEISYYTPQGAVDRYQLDATVDGVSLSGVYNTDGQLMNLFYKDTDTACYFDADANEWFDFSSDPAEQCEPPEGFDLSSWMTLDAARLATQAQ